MNQAATLFAATAVLALVAADATAQSRGRVRAAGDHGVAVAGAGPKGGAVVRGRGAVQNPDGSVTSASGAVRRGPQGGRLVRGGTTTVNPDGSAVRQGGIAAQGPNGGYGWSSGTLARNPDGTYAGARSTEATGPQGATYQGSTSYDPATGLTRSTTCTNASGAVVACR